MIPVSRNLNCYQPAGNLCLLLAAGLWLCACAIQPSIDQQAGRALFETHRAKLAELQSWRLQGRLALAMAREAWSATLHWTQNTGDYQLRLIAPLGRGSFELRGNDQGVILRLTQDQVLRADDPESLLRKQFGWTVPVSGLRYWIRGIPDPEAKTGKLLFDAQGRISALEQSGWKVSYADYASQGDYILPGRIALANDQIKLRLVIRNWNL